MDRILFCQKSSVAFDHLTICFSKYGTNEQIKINYEYIRLNYI